MKVLDIWNGISIYKELKQWHVGYHLAARIILNSECEIIKLILRSKS